MGIFSSKYEHTVDTQVQRLIEDEAMLDPNLRAIVSTIFSEDTDIAAALQNTAINGASKKFHQMYRYAERGDYAYGLPNVNIRGSDEGVPLATSALVTELGETPTIEYMIYRPLNNIHMGWQTLTESYGYSHATNEIVTLSATKPNPVYLDKMVAVHTAIDGRPIKHSALGTFEASASAGVTPDRPAWEDPLARQTLTANQEVRIGVSELESVEIHYVWLDATGATATDILIVDLSSYGTETEFYHAKYVLADGTIGYWLQDPQLFLAEFDYITDLYDPFIPGVSTPLGTSPEGTYFPFAIMRSAGEDRSTEALKETPKFKSTTKLLDYIGLDFFELGESLRGAAGIEQTEQIVIMMGVPLSSQNEVEVEYLYAYFSDLYDKLPAAAQSEQGVSDVPTLESVYGLSSGRHTSYAAQISDADFEMQIGFEYIERKYEAGTIGPVGTVYNTFVPYVHKSNLTGFNLLIGQVTGVMLNRNRVFRKQIRPDVYEVITVVAPYVKYKVWGEYLSEGSFTDMTALIPIDRVVAKKLGSHKLSDLYQRSLHMVINSHVVTETKWYQTTVFQVIVFVIAVLIAIFFQNPSGFKVAAGLGASALTAFILTVIIKQIILQVVIGYVFEVVAEAIGVENAFWLAVVATFVAGADTLSNSATAASGMAATASVYLQVANGLIAGGMAVLEDMYEDLQGEAAEWALLAEAQTDELKKIQRELDSNIGLNPNEFIGQVPLIPHSESPELYLFRTMGSGIDTYPKISDFNYRMTKLPTMDESMRGLMTWV